MPEPRIRREPPRFRTVRVRRTEHISPFMKRVIVGGAELDGFSIGKPAASVRLLLPTIDILEIPTWTGNEFLLTDGNRPIIRTFTPRRFNRDAQELQIDVVLHDSGRASEWASTTQAGDVVAISGPGRGYDIAPAAHSFVLAGDETAIPAICQLLEHLPEVPIQVHISVRHPDAKVNLHRDVDVNWHVNSDTDGVGDPLLNAISATEIPPDTHVWAAGEAASMQRLRRYMFGEVGFPRANATIRGYWKYIPS